jgi:hypothetical protein
MHISKVIETSVDLYDAEMYVMDIAALLLKKLNARYASTCYLSMFINNVDEIIRYSDIYQVDNRLDGGAYVNVSCKVSGITYVKGEIIHGCQVVHIDVDGMIIKHKHIVGKMYPDETKQAFNVIKKTDIIPIIIDDVTYATGKQEVTVSCRPYTPVASQRVVYRVTSAMTQEQVAKYNILLAQLTSEMERHKSISSAKNYKLFEQIMYPLKTKPVGDGKVITLDDIIQRASCVVSVGEPTDDIFEVNGTPLVVDVYQLVSSVLISKIKYYEALRGFVETYVAIPDKNSSLFAYWRICNMLKK